MKNFARKVYSQFWSKPIDDNVEIVLGATESLRNKKNGGYFENIVEICQTKHGWNNAITSAALDEAIKQNKIFSSVVNGKQFYRKCGKRVCIENYYENRYTKQIQCLSMNISPKRTLIEYKNI